MTAAELSDVFARIPSLAGEPRRVEELSGGLTNRNVKVTTPDGVFVARCTDVNAEMLAIDREAEFRNSKCAEEAGVGAPVLEYRPELGVLVIGFLDGYTLGRADFTKQDMVRRVADACRRLHAGPRFVGEFNMFERQQGYLETARRHGYGIPEGYLGLMDKVEQMRKALVTLDEGNVPCNNDLLAENFVDDGEKIWLIDYEYCGNNDACFELGNIWMECRLEVDQLEELVTAYYGRPRPSKLARARLLGALGQYGWTMWGAIQDAVSPLDFDFWGWAMERHEFALSELTSDHFDDLLNDVQISE